MDTCMKTQSSNVKNFRAKLNPVIIALNAIFVGAVLSQVPLIAQPSYAALANKPAGAGVAVIAVSSATDASSSDLSKAAASLKSKGYDVRFAIPADANSAKAIAKIASSGGYGTVNGTGAQIAASLPNAVAYGDKAAMAIAAQLKGQKSDSNGAYDINGNLTATSGANSASVLSATQKSVGELKGAVEEPLKSPVEEALSQGDITLMEQLQLAGVDSLLPVMPFPTQFDRAAGRYGQWRSNGTDAGRYHAGWDLSTPYKGGSRERSRLTWMGVPASAQALVVSGGNSLRVVRPNGDSYYYFHLTNPVTKCVGKEFWPTVPGGPGFCGTVGNTGTGITDIHMHMGYGVSARDQDKRRRQAWLPRSSSARSTYSGGTSMKNIKPHADGVSAYQSDITPYLSHDMTIKNDYHSPWLGSTMRQQFNALYGTRLPTGADDPSNFWPGAKYSDGAVRIPSSSLKPVSLMPRWGKYEWTPDQIAAARAGTIKGMYSGEYPAGMYMASPGMVASFLKEGDGDAFGSLPQLADAPDITAQSARQIIQNIGTLRYGNRQWHEAMLKLSSKAMMTDYVAMTAAENYIEQQNTLVMQRIETLMAGLIQSRTAPLQGRIEAIAEIATADIIPNVINTKVTEMQYAYSGVGAAGSSIDLANLPDGMDGLVKALFETIAGAESHGDYGAYNTGTKGGRTRIKSCYSTTSGCQNLITKNVGQIFASHGLPNTNLGRMFAVGKYQLIDLALTDALNAGAFPNGRATVYTPEVQEALVYNFFLKTKRPLLGKFVAGNLNVSANAALYNIAMEWASIGVPNGERTQKNRVSDGTVSYYDEKKVNKANPKRTATVVAIITKMDQIRRGGGAEAPAAP